ncbi:ornithine carbamoyltransferase [Candidatus Marinamargulisbacteria bacterium SCGC AG-410-N11]|nr:ornithine carbamoyltransferase [Candidatus Marinamargulisbacteria bacterium SCGC AG-410-N11]
MSERHFLDILDYDRSTINHILQLANQLKSETVKGNWSDCLRHKSLGLLFQKPSMRTRVSFELGMNQLGGTSLVLQNQEIGIGERESVSDIARVLSSYLDIIMIRTFEHSIVTELARYSSVPVINGLSDFSHPCQALADLMTIKELKPNLAGLKLCYIGDGNNVCRSLFHICKLFNISFYHCCPAGFELPDDGVVVSDNIDNALQNADIVYTDVWASMGQEAETAKRLQLFKDFCITSELMAKANSDAVFLHCLPAHRGQEVTHDVMESAQSVVFHQAENRLHAQKGLLVYLLENH